MRVELQRRIKASKRSPSKRSRSSSSQNPRSKNTPSKSLEIIFKKEAERNAETLEALQKSYITKEVEVLQIEGRLDRKEIFSLLKQRSQRRQSSLTEVRIFLKIQSKKKQVCHQVEDSIFTSKYLFIIIKSSKNDFMFHGEP